MDTSLIIALIGVVSTIAGFLFGSRKRQAEAIGYELNNVQKAIQVWKEVAEYQTSEIASLRAEINELKEELNNLEKMHRKQCTGANVTKAVMEFTNIVSSLKDKTIQFHDLEKNIELQISKNQNNEFYQ